MLNPFPILYLAPIALLALRISVAVFLVYGALQHVQYREELGRTFSMSWFPYGGPVAVAFPLAELIIAGLLFLGLHVQYAMLVLMAMSLKIFIVRPWFAHPSIPERSTYFLLFFIALTLFVSGAGAFAFDLPL